jgi:hypothetical protein
MRRRTIEPIFPPPGYNLEIPGKKKKYNKKIPFKI